MAITPKLRRKRAADLIERVFVHVENGDTRAAVVACLRLARVMKDTFNIMMFLRELHPDRKQIASEFYAETSHLKEDAREWLWKTTLDHWIEGRSYDKHDVPAGEEPGVQVQGVEELQNEVVQTERLIQDQQLPPGMGEYDTAAFTDRVLATKAQLRVKIRLVQKTLARISTRCISYATRMESQLAAQRTASAYMSGVQRDVHNYYAARSETVHQKLQKVASLAASTSAEDQALLLTAVRRVLKAVADFHQPAVASPSADASGPKLTDQAYLNRLQEFCNRLVGCTADDLLCAEVALLASFTRRVHELASKGVHASVSRAEARQGVLSMYLVLSNLITRITVADSSKPPEQVGT